PRGGLRERLTEGGQRSAAKDPFLHGVGLDGGQVMATAQRLDLDLRRSWTSGREKCTVTDPGANSGTASSASMARRMVAAPTPPSGDPGPSHAGSTRAPWRPGPLRWTAVTVSKPPRAVLTVSPPRIQAPPGMPCHQPKSCQQVYDQRP